MATIKKEIFADGFLVVSAYTDAYSTIEFHPDPFTLFGPGTTMKVVLTELETGKQIINEIILPVNFTKLPTQEPKGIKE